MSGKGRRQGWGGAQLVSGDPSFLIRASAPPCFSRLEFQISFSLWPLITPRVGGGWASGGGGGGLEGHGGEWLPRRHPLPCRAQVSAVRSDAPRTNNKGVLEPTLGGHSPYPGVASASPLPALGAALVVPNENSFAAPPLLSYACLSHKAQTVKNPPVFPRRWGTGGCLCVRALTLTSR